MGCISAPLQKNNGVIEMMQKRIIYNPQSEILPSSKNIRRDINCRFDLIIDGEGKRWLHRLLKQHTLKIITSNRSMTATYKGLKIIENVADDKLLIFDLSNQEEVLLDLSEIKKVLLLS